MRVVFVTANDLGLACLEELDGQGADVRGVFTHPPSDAVAKQTDLEPFTTDRGIPLHETTSVNTPESKSRIREYDPELLFVVGWSQLVDGSVLDLPSVAALGMHPAPLPRGRGRAPTAWCLIKGLEETKLSLFHLVEEADAGDLVGQVPIDIEIEDDAGSLFEKVTAAGRDLVREHYPAFERGEAPRSSQDNSRATWWPRRRPHHGLIDWNLAPMDVYNWIRGQTHPYPGAFSYIDERKVTVWAANPPSDGRVYAAPGEICGKTSDGLRVAAWEGALEITRIQLEGGPERPAAALLTEGDVEVGDRFQPARDRLER